MQQLKDVLNINQDLIVKKRELEADRITREHQRLEMRKKGESEYKPFSVSNYQDTDLEGAILKHETSIREKLPFITPEISDSIPVLKGQKYLIGGRSGTGKTTMGAAMTYEILMHDSAAKVLYLSNEEQRSDFLFRLGCLHTRLNINGYKKGQFTKEQTNTMLEAAKLFEKRVVFVKDQKTTSVNGIMEILQAPETNQFSAVFIDYYQGITRLNELDNADLSDSGRTKILDAFKHSLTSINPTYPIILLSQLKPQALKDTERNVESRIKWNTSIYEACDWVFESISITSAFAMTLYVSKARYGEAHKMYFCKYEFGRYISLTDDEFEEYIAKQHQEQSDIRFQKIMARADSYLKGDQKEKANANQ
jgi:hypothetical protein